MEGETRETFLWDKIDEVEHSDLLMFHYSSWICVFGVVRGRPAVSATTPCCHEVLPLVLTRLAHRLTVLTSTSLPLHSGQTFTNAEQLLNFSNKKKSFITARSFQPHCSIRHFKVNYVFFFSWRYNPHWGLYFTAL